MKIKWTITVLRESYINQLNGNTKVSTRMRLEQLLPTIEKSALSVVSLV